MKTYFILFNNQDLKRFWQMSLCIIISLIENGFYKKNTTTIKLFMIIFRNKDYKFKNFKTFA